MEKKHDAIIDEIQNVRSKNNSYWMDILRIAMKHAPEETKEALKKINNCDMAISVLVSHLAKSPSPVSGNPQEKPGNPSPQTLR